MDNIPSEGDVENVLIKLESFIDEFSSLEGKNRQAEGFFCIES